MGCGGIVGMDAVWLLLVSKQRGGRMCMGVHGTWACYLLFAEMKRCFRLRYIRVHGTCIRLLVVDEKKWRSRWIRTGVQGVCAP